MTKKILHICVLDKFIPSYIALVREHFPEGKHFFLTKGDIEKYTYTIKNDSKHIKASKNKLFDLFYSVFHNLKNMYQAERIILHNLFDHKVVCLLALNPWLLKKCFWVIWGADLYAYKKNNKKIIRKIYEKIRHFIIKRMGYLVTYIHGDYDLARKWYGAQGQYIECIMYLSNVVNYNSFYERHDSTINILLGNSADPTNNHIEALKKLIPFQNENIKIYAPLSYGNVNYAKLVSCEGDRMFGSKFVPLKKFVSINEYNQLLDSIDIAVFNHDRQQGMGNIINLLGLGKTVYLRSDITTWSFFESKNIKVYDVSVINLNKIHDLTSIKNTNIIRKYFSESTLINQLDNIFNHRL